MGASPNNSGNFGDTGVIELTGKIMVVAIVLLFFVVVFVFCLHLYAKYFWYRRNENTTTTTTRRRRRRFDFAAGHQEITVVAALRRGLDPSVLKTIPIVVYDSKQFKDGLECAVCLCEVSEGEKTRLLPHCSHGFHVECIDMWFQSHSTCPLCRNPVSNPSQETNTVESPLETMLQAPTLGDNSNFPTNVLIWGDENAITTLVPSLEENHQSNAISEPSSSMASTSIRPDVMNEDEEQKSSVPTRLRSLKRLLSGSSRRVNPSSPRNLDLEQGGRAQS